MRCIRSQTESLISGLPGRELAAMQLGLAHRLANILAFLSSKFIFKKFSMMINFLLTLHIVEVLWFNEPEKTLCNKLAEYAAFLLECWCYVLWCSFSLSRYKLKFSPDKVDTMIVQAISLLDDLDKELNNYVMRAREWYGWHFPELGKIVTDNVAFAKTVKLMGEKISNQ